MNAAGLVTGRSHDSVEATIDRLAAALAAAGATVFARIDHAAGAASVDMPLRPTELLIFGNPRAGTPLMQADQRIGIELPLKALAWEDADGAVWLSYNDPSWLADRYGLGEQTESAVDALSAALAKLTGAAAG